MLLSALAVLLAGVAPPAIPVRPAPARSAVPRFHYLVTMPDPGAHLFGIAITFDQLPRDTVRLQMPVWSPGRYARMDFAKNVQDFSVVTANGAPVRWDRENGSLWRLYPSAPGPVTVRYRVFADKLSGTFSVLDTLHANWNGASLFLYLVGHKADPVTLHVTPPAGWHVVNGDARQVDQLDYTFENYDRLIDTPTELAPAFLVDTFTVDGRLYRTVVHANGPTTPAERARFVAAIRGIVTAHNRVIAPPPLRMYTFLVHVGFPGGDGMEHLYSTQIIDHDPWSDTATVLSGVATAAHEYFHVWNVKRIRPIALGPFDYTRAQYEPSLWVAEGWTQYYGEMAYARAGFASVPDMYAQIAGLVQANLTAPGRREVSARMASFEAPFFDGAATPMPTNARNSYFTYYYRGGGLALALDLMIRNHSNGLRSLDDALRNLKQLSWDQPNASYYLQGRGYTEADVERAVSQAMGTDMHRWFDRYVGGTEDVPYDSVLALAGLRLERVADAPWRLVNVPDPTPRQRAIREERITDTRARTTLHGEAQR